MSSHTSSTPCHPENIRRNQAPPDPPPGPTDQDMRSAVKLLTSLLAAQAQRQNTGVDKPASTRVRDFINLEPLLFTGYDLKEDPQTFIDQVHRTLWVMHATDTEAVELAFYRLQDLAVFMYDSWERSRGPNAPPVGQGSRASGSQHHRDTSQTRPPTPRCDQCGKAHFGQCHQGSDACYSCGQPGYMMRDFPYRGGGSMAQPTGSMSGSSSSV
ncbi:PREDICTED: uncharacterized protein LOC109214733 [Nicotiana attenuata]|uniref:uncharacterized protein LOC109214733 n=1 Tax=Nicotiana attenuata TaxID=49451 RepID=UPI0009051264|nr:PREDICTED: uncharacterized protein LOC109214733 [Nicotiana attenuata]